MEYTKIIKNILNDSEQIAQCEYTLSNIETSLKSNADTDEILAKELIQTARYLSLDKINFETKANASESFMKIIQEIDSVIESISMYLTKNSDTKDNNDDTVVSLQLSSIIDSILQNLSKYERKIYLYRYFMCYSLDDIASLCGSSAENISKVIFSANCLLKKELQNTNIQCNAKTLLQSFADIDANYLNTVIHDSPNGNGDISDKCKKRDPKNVKKISMPRNKIFNILFSVLAVALIITNLYLITDKHTPKDLSTDEKNTTQTEETNKDKYEYIVRDINGSATVDIDKLLSYRSDNQNFNLSLTYDSTYFVGTYYEIPFDEAVPLDKCIGTEIKELRADNKEYYQLKGINSKQYIIEKSYDTYRLHCLNLIAQRNDLDESILGVEFSEVLANYYGLSIDQQIESITVKHAGTNANFDDIKVSRLIDNSTDVYKIFDIMSESVCTGETLSILTSDPNFSYDYLAESSVQLIIEKPDGTIIDSIYYRPGYYYFFDFSQMIVFTPVAEEDVIFSDYDPSNMDVRPGDEYEIIKIESYDKEAHTITFKTKSFSNFAIAMTAGAPDTGYATSNTSATLSIIGSMLAGAIIATSIYLLNRREA